MIEKAQVRAARAMLGWSQEQLAEAAGLSVPTIKRLEAGRGPTSAKNESATKVQLAFENAGIEFVNEVTGSGDVKISVRMLTQDRLTSLPAIITNLHAISKRLLALYAAEDKQRIKASLDLARRAVNDAMIEYKEELENYADPVPD